MIVVGCSRLLVVFVVVVSGLFVVVIAVCLCRLFTCVLVCCYCCLLLCAVCGAFLIGVAVVCFYCSFVASFNGDVCCCC